METSDQELLGRIRAGDAAALEALLSRYENRIYRYALKLCGNGEEAKEVVQETFLAALRYIKDFREEAKLSTWFYKVASSICVKMHRKRKDEPEKELSLEQFMPPEGEMAPFSLSIPDTAKTPEEEILHAEAHKVLDRAIRSLPPAYRTVLVLRDVEGFSTEETSETLEITPAAVKVRLHRARLFLREKLTGYFRGRETAEVREAKDGL